MLEKLLTLVSGEDRAKEPTSCLATASTYNAGGGTTLDGRELLRAACAVEVDFPTSLDDGVRQALLSARRHVADSRSCGNDREDYGDVLHLQRWMM